MCVCVCVCVSVCVLFPPYEVIHGLSGHQVVDTNTVLLSYTIHSIFSLYQYLHTYQENHTTQRPMYTPYSLKLLQVKTRMKWQKYSLSWRKYSWIVDWKCGLGPTMRSGDINSQKKTHFRNVKFCRCKKLAACTHFH